MARQMGAHRRRPRERSWQRDGGEDVERPPRATRQQHHEQQDGNVERRRLALAPPHSLAVVEADTIKEMLRVMGNLRASAGANER